MYVLISYDIGSNTRRQKMHDLLRNYGRWIQYSVFECRLTEPQCTTLRQRMASLIRDDEDDNIRIYQLCEDCRQQIEQVGLHLREEEAVSMYQ